MSSLASLSCYPQRASFDMRAPLASPPPPPSSLDSSATTRSMHHPAAPTMQMPLAHKLHTTTTTTATTTLPLAMPVYTPSLKGPQHWHAHPHPPATSPSHRLSSPHAQVVPATVPYHSGLAASLLAHKQQHQNMGVAPPTAAAATPAADISPTLSLPLMQRSESVPSSSGSTASFNSAFGSAAASPLPSPRRGGDSPTEIEPPCPISLWFGCEDATHARCVLAAYATKLQLYTQQAPGCRAPLEFIGRVRRDRLDVAKLHRAVEQFHAKARQRASQRQPRQRYASAASPRYSGGAGRRPFASSPCLSSFSPSSSPCSSGLMSEPSALDRLPAAGSFATLDLVSVYSRDTLPLGLAFPLIRHEWVCTVWNREDGVAESCTRIHTEYEDDEEEDAAGEEKRQNDDDDEDTRAKRVLQLYAKSVQKTSKRMSSAKGSPLTQASRALQQQQERSPHPFSLTASVTSAPPGLWHPATSPSQSQSDQPHPSASSSTSSTLLQQSIQSQSQCRSRSVSHTPPAPAPLTSFLYCLPIFSEDTKNGSYDTFGCRVQRDTDATFASSRSARGPAPSVSQAGSVATVGDHSLGYAGAQNSCIYECMKTLGRKIAGGSNAGLGVGNGGDDSAGEATCAQTVVDPEMEMRAIAAALTKMHQQQTQQQQQQADGRADDTTASESSESRSESRDTEDDSTLDSIGEDVMFSGGVTPGTEATGFEFGASDDEPDEEESSGSDSSDSSDSESDSDSSSDSSDDSDAESTRPTRNASGSKAVVIQGAGASRRSHGVAHDDDSDDSDDDDDISSSCASSFARSYGAGSGSLAAGSLGDELAAQLMALNGGRAPANKGRK